MLSPHEYRQPVSLLALLAAVVGVGGFLASLYVSNPYPQVVGPLVFVGASSWLLLRDQDLSIEQIHVPTGLYVGAYLWWLGGTVLLYVSAGYQRTFAVHLALIGLFALALAAVVVTDSTFLRLGVLVPTGVVQRATMYYASALQIGNDAVWHARMASEIAALGTLEPLAVASSKYWYMPLHHLLIAGVSSVARVPVRDATFLAVTVPLVILPLLTMYGILSALGYRTVGVVAAWMYLVADRPIGQSVHAIPTSTGVLFAVVILLAAFGYLYRDDGSYLVVFFAALVGQFFTHPISLFATTVIVVSFVAGQVLWTRTVRLRETLLALAVTVALATQVSVARYQGPRMQETILSRILQNVRNIFRSSGGREIGPPPTGDFVVTGSDTLSMLQLAGVGLLFGMGVLGALLWLSNTDRVRQAVIAALCATVAAMSVTVYLPPLVGINILFPYRLMSYLYVPLVMLAAAGFVAIARSLDRQGAVAVAVVLLVVGAPYAAAMSWNSTGSLEDPVLDDAPTAQRLSATPTEAATYSFTATYGNGERVVADRIAANYLERGAAYPASTYAMNYSTGETTFDGQRLVVDRAYAHTESASYYVRYRGRWYVVFGPLPADRASLERNHSVVFAAGDDRVVYASPNSST